MKNKKAPPPIKQISIKASHQICTRRTIVRQIMKDNDLSESEANLFFEVFLAAKSIQEANAIGLTGAKSYQVVKDSWI
jgi:hypothetical protein